MKIIDNVADKITRVVEFLVIILFAITLSACVLQVFTRYVLNNSIRWTDELARYSFIYGNVLGAVLMQRIHGHAAVTFLVGLLPEKGEEVMAIFTSIVILTVSIILTYSGVQMVVRTTKQLSPGMGLPLCYVYLSMVIGGALFTFFTLVDLAHQCVNLKKSNLEQVENRKGED